MLQWLISMIDMNERAKTIPGGLAKFDDMVMLVNTRHSDVPFDKKLYFEVWWCEFLQRKLLTQLIVQFAVTGMFKDVFDVHVFC